MREQTDRPPTARISVSRNGMHPSRTSDFRKGVLRIEFHSWSTTPENKMAMDHKIPHRSKNDVTFEKHKLYTSISRGACVARVPSNERRQLINLAQRGLSGSGHIRVETINVGTLTNRKRELADLLK